MKSVWYSRPAGSAGAAKRSPSGTMARIRCKWMRTARPSRMPGDPGTKGPGPGPGARGQGPGARGQGPGASGQGPGAKDQGPGTGDQGPGAKERGIRRARHL